MSETSAALKLPTQMLANQAAAIDSKVSNVAQDFSEWLGRQSWVPESLATLLLFVWMLALAAIIYFVFRPLILRGVAHYVGKTDIIWDNELVGHGVFRWLTHLLPGIFIFLLVPGLFKSEPSLANILR